MTCDYEVVRSTNELPDEVDCLVVLGKQFGAGNNRRSIENYPAWLSQESWWNVLAAGMLASSGSRMRDIIISGNGRAFFPGAALTELMQKFGIIVPMKNIDNRSKNTRDSARNVPALEVFQNATEPALVTVGYHGERSRRHFAKAGHDINYVVASEDIVAEDSFDCEEAVNEWRAQPNVRRDMAKEVRLNRHPYLADIGSMAVNLARP
jgi:hypothetical protein